MKLKKSDLCAKNTLLWCAFLERLTWNPKDDKHDEQIMRRTNSARNFNELPPEVIPSAEKIWRKFSKMTREEWGIERSKTK